MIEIFFFRSAIDDMWDRSADNWEGPIIEIRRAAAGTSTYWRVWNKTYTV
jgi:hypothetical protein